MLLSPYSRCYCLCSCSIFLNWILLSISTAFLAVSRFIFRAPIMHANILFKKEIHHDGIRIIKMDNHDDARHRGSYTSWFQRHKASKIVSHIKAKDKRMGSKCFRKGSPAVNMQNHNFARLFWTWSSRSDL